MAIKDILRFIRKLKNLSQKDLENKSGIHNRLVQMYESGKRIPKDDNLQKLADALDVEINALKDIDIDADNPEAIRQLLFQLYENGIFDLSHSFLKSDKDRGDGKEQFFLTVPIDRDMAQFLEQWRIMSRGSILVEDGKITYDEWKYDRGKREQANQELLKKGRLKPHFKADETEEK